MRGAPELPTRLCRRIMLESASPIAFADYASLYQCMPWSNLAKSASLFHNAIQFPLIQLFSHVCELHPVVPKLPDRLRKLSDRIGALAVRILEWSEIRHAFG